MNTSSPSENTIKALSLTQPWATLVAIGAKQIETRSWKTDYRGPLAIHAAKGLPRWVLQETILKNPRFSQALSDGYGLDWLPSMNAVRGCIVAVCNLVAIVPTTQMTNGGTWWDGPDGRRYEYRLSEQEEAFGDYAPGRWAWLLADVEVLPEPIPAKGALGLWTMDREGLGV